MRLERKVRSMGRSIILTLVVSVAVLQSGKAAPLASTSFDGRTLTTTRVANDTASNLNWTVLGLLDPGNMAALRQGGNGWALFNGTTLTQNAFTPAINVGNWNTFWWTDVSITVASGYAVTITNVTFDYQATSGGEALNVARKSDFSLALYTPGFDTSTNADWPPNGQPGAPIGEVFIDDIKNGNYQPVTGVNATFSSPLNLSLPGTYTLRIVAAEGPETGNHIGIDNLSINGNAIILSGPGSVLIVK